MEKYTETELLELKTHLEAVRDWFHHNDPPLFIFVPFDSKRAIEYTLEDIESYIRHQIRGEPYSEDEIADEE